jgi:acetyl esterase/lipase
LLRKIRHTLGFLALLVLAGCARVDLLNALIPTDGVAVTRNVAYGPDPRQKLDVYTPRKVAADAPVVVFFYGGTWQTGDKGDYLFAAQSLASTGAIVVVPDYRLYPNVTFPTFLEDGGAATAWAIDHIARTPEDPRPIFVAGHSAGAYIAIMVALDPQYLAKAGASTATLAGAIGISGPYDFLPLTRTDVKPIFEVTPDMTMTQPIHYARPDAPALLLVTGLSDITVGPYHTQHLADRMRALGGHVEDRYYPDVDHIDSVLALTYLFRGRAPVLADIARFMNEHRQDGAGLH